MKLCPKCHTLSLVPGGSGYFCIECSRFFDVENLAKFWGWDVGDVYDIRPLPDAPTFEPAWKSWWERQDDYTTVDRMFIGIPEWSMEDNSVDTGATHV